jgi:hypothetical protein
MIRRREFITLGGAALFSWVLSRAGVVTALDFDPGRPQVGSEQELTSSRQHPDRKLARTSQIIVVIATPHQNRNRRNNKQSHHPRANDVWNDTESLVAKPGSKYKLDQHCAYSGRNQPAQRQTGGIRFHFVRR